MAASPSDFHHVTIGDRLTACGQPASGRDGVLFRTDNPEQVTCEVCRKRKKLRGPIRASAKRVAEAGRIIESAMTRGGIAQRQEYVSVDFLSDAYVKEQLIPRMRRLAKKEGKPMQARWDGRLWRIFGPEEPQSRAAFLVDVDGTWKRGPNYRATFG